jgi:hypothetical protein
MKTKAFLSYCRQDSAKVNALERYLRDLGIDVLKDTYELKVNDDIESAVHRLVTSQADLVIVALTNNSLASPWVAKEREFAERAKALGRPTEIVYVKLKEGTYVPDAIQRRLFVDLATADKGAKQDSLMRLARYLLRRPPWISTGVYEIYADLDDLNARREDSQGQPGCSIDEFLALAQSRIISVGLWFGFLLGMDQGAALAELLHSRPQLTIDLYVPDPDTAAREQLALIHESGQEVWNRVTERIHAFSKWGKARGLTASDASRIRLHLLRFVPTASILAVDPWGPAGRIILDLYTPGIAPSRQAKLELRHPKTKIYQTYLQSLEMMTRPSVISRMIPTDY